MKKFYRWFSGIAFLGVCLLGACASVPESSGKKTERETAAQRKESVSAGAAQKNQNPSLRLSPGETPRAAAGMAELPPEARNYLEILREAFRAKDTEFLAAQGETQYEKDLRPTMDEDAYLALLYRYGPYSEDKDWKSPALVHLDTSAVDSIEFTGWEEKGPMLDISGRLHLRNADSAPCRILLIWRLKEPKILGAWP